MPNTFAGTAKPVTIAANQEHQAASGDAPKPERADAKESKAEP
jgi:hypothetical protein